MVMVAALPMQFILQMTFVYAVAEKTGAGIDAVALSANPAVITCLGNDVGYENIYSEQLAVAGREGDILLVFSGSGNSQNVIIMRLKLLAHKT